MLADAADPLVPLTSPVPAAHPPPNNTSWFRLKNHRGPEFLRPPEQPRFARGPQTNSELCLGKKSHGASSSSSSLFGAPDFWYHSSPPHFQSPMSLGDEHHPAALQDQIQLELFPVNSGNQREAAGINTCCSFHPGARGTSKGTPAQATRS